MYYDQRYSKVNPNRFLRLKMCPIIDDTVLVRSSVTRFGEILPLWQKFTSIWQIFDSLFLFGKMLSTLWQMCDIIGLIFIGANGHILKNNLTIWSHWFPALLSRPQIITVTVIGAGTLARTISSKNFFSAYLLLSTYMMEFRPLGSSYVHDQDLQTSRCPISR